MTILIFLLYQNEWMKFVFVISKKNKYFIKLINLAHNFCFIVKQILVKSQVMKLIVFVEHTVWWSWHSHSGMCHSKLIDCHVVHIVQTIKDKPRLKRIHWISHWCQSYAFWNYFSEKKLIRCLWFSFKQYGTILKSLLWTEIIKKINSFSHLISGAFQIKWKAIMSNSKLLVSLLRTISLWKRFFSEKIQSGFKEFFWGTANERLCLSPNLSKMFWIVVLPVLWFLA